ncbi:MAG: HmuY family protein [Bacteroidota bacterium]
MRNRLFSTLFVAALLVFSGCDSSSSEEFMPPEVQMAVDIPADPIVGFGPRGPVGAGVITFYSLRENRIVPAADSASAAWDIALQSTTIFTNGGASGPGQGGAQVVEALFEEVTEAPATGYSTDATSGFAIPTGSGNGWYNYNPQANVVSPIPGRVLVVRCADGTFAKIRMMSYYKGNPANPTSADESRHYTFEFVHQPDGSRRFE